MAERELVHRHLYPTFITPSKADLLDDQYAFTQTGSAVLRQMSTLLKTNNHVTLVSLGFSRAFDTVRHSTLTEKLSRFDLPGNIFNWLVNFLHDRRHES